MIKREEKEVLQETKNNAYMAREAIRTILDKVYNEKLAYELNCQEKKYRKIEQKAEEEMRKFGIESHGKKLKKATLWWIIQANTLLNISTKHLVEIMIRGNARGMTDLMRVKHNNKINNSYANELADELMDFQEKNIEKLKTYL